MLQPRVSKWRLPDKWIRRELHDRLDDIIVDSTTVPVYDINATNFDGKYYIILSTQSNTRSENKCGGVFNHDILLDIVTRYPLNTGSRVFADDICQQIIDSLEEFEMPEDSEMKLHNLNFTLPPDLTSQTQSEIIHRKFIRLQISIS